MGQESRRYWLRDLEDTLIPVDQGGVLIGRHNRCDIVSGDPTASRHQALVLPSGTGLEVRHMGKNPTRINGTVVLSVDPLAEGDQIEMPGCSLTVITEPDDPGEQPAAAASPSWLLERAGVSAYSINESPYLVGGGHRDQLRLREWPASLLRFETAGPDLFAEAIGPVTCNGHPMPLGDPTPMRAGDRLEHGGIALRVLSSATEHIPTAVSNRDEALPWGIELQFLHRGGRLILRIPSRTVKIVLSELRLNLLAVLVQPVRGREEDEYFDDEELIARIWPRNPGKTRRDLNSLVYWTRRILDQAGLVGEDLVDRDPDGAGTRFRRQPGARVEFIQ